MLFDPQLTGLTATLLSYLIDIEPICQERYSEADKEYFRVSTSFINKYIRGSAKTIKRALDSLEAAGYISVKIRGATLDKKRYVRIEQRRIEAAIDYWLENRSNNDAYFWTPDTGAIVSSHADTDTKDSSNMNTGVKYY